MSRDLFGIRLVCACAAVCLIVATPAMAQQERPTGGPFTGLFKGSPKEQPHTLDLRLSAFAAWDDNLLAQVPNIAPTEGLATVDPSLIQQGLANGFQGGAAYGFRRNGTRSQFSLNGDASVQEFGSGLGRRLWFQSYAASTSFRTSVTSRTAVSVSAGAGYHPYYQYAPFLKSTTSAESPVGSDTGFAVDSTWVQSRSAAASIENRLSKKSTLTGSVLWDQRTLTGNENFDLASRSAQAVLNHNLTRKLAVHVGYGIMDSSYGTTPDAEPVRTHSLDIGLGYGDGITFTIGRHYTLSLGIGAQIAKNGDPALVLATGKQSALVVTGGAILSRSIGRSWGASLGYSRGTSYMVGFQQPVMTDSANAGLGGPLSDRIQFSIGAGASRGQQLFAASSGSLISYTASTRLSFAIFKNLGLYSQASYYRFSIPTDFINFGFVPDLDRRSASVGLTTWIPLIKQRRAPRDSNQPPTGQP